MDLSKAIDKKSGAQGEKIGERKFGKTSTGQSSGWHDNHIAQTGKQDVFAPATDLAKQWHGWGTALKPSYESIILARKPFKGSCIDNIIKWGVGGINIDECRIGAEERTYKGMSSHKPEGAGTFRDDNWQPKDIEVTVNGRFPANTILTYDDTDFEEVCGGFPNTKKNGNINNPNLKNSLGNNGIYNKYSEKQPLWEAYNDSGSASRYFYCAKASKRDRDCEGAVKNIHPTCKPTSLMQYLVRLVTPKGGTILDPFMGSGSTGKAVAFENKDRQADYSFIGIERESEYCDIARARIEWSCQYEEKKEEDNQIKFDDLEVNK